MPALPTPRASLCFFCSFAARRPRLSPQRLLPRTQAVQRSTHENHKKRNGSRPNRFNYGHPSFLSDYMAPVHNRMAELRRDLREPEFLRSLHMDRDTFDGEWAIFKRDIDRWIQRSPPDIVELARGAHWGGKAMMLKSRLRHLFYAQVYGGRFTKAEQENQKQVADLRYPAEWYPATREIPRTVHLHVGPTNSGKTYHALKRLEEAESGIYLGPLRLLAHEVYTRLNAKGKTCALVTGEEQRLPDGPTKMWSCTVEMAPLNAKLEVAVIDEIQMINHDQRGWAWTQAFLGVQAREVHLCGEARTVPIIKELCALVGDKVVVHEYERLTPLQVAPQSLNYNLQNLEKGDCIVAFSVLGLHALRKEVETKTGRKCAIVYGSLPPETRAQQARLFNDPDNDYDFLVASDAIGMGLNLSIKRVIFESMTKNNGSKFEPLRVSDVKQIGGRAGRYRSLHQDITADAEARSDSAIDPVMGLDDVKEVVPQKAAAAPPTVGFVTTLVPEDLSFLTSAMNREPEPIETAGLFPPALTVERFASYFPPGTPFSYVMLRLHELSNIHPRFHLCGLRDQLAIADVIHPVKNLSIADRIIICAAPTNMRNEGERAFLYTLAQCIAEKKSGELLDLPDLPIEILDQEPTAKREYLASLETLHKKIVAYLWLSYRFPHVFTTRKLANYLKKLTEDAIERTLVQFSWSNVRSSQRREKRRLHEQEEEEKKAFGLGLPPKAPDALNEDKPLESEVRIDAPTLPADAHDEGRARL